MTLLVLVVEPSSPREEAWLLIVQSISFSNLHAYVYTLRCGRNGYKEFPAINRVPC